MKTKTQWAASNVDAAKYIGPVEFQDSECDWHNFDVMALPDRLIFGSPSNAVFLESGYILRKEGETLDETLSELLADLECYYNDGPTYVSRIVCNGRM